MPKPLLAFALAAFAATAGAQQFPIPNKIQEHTTPNGMKVLVQEDPSIPDVALYNWFRVGSRNEHEGITGISHFFEHMMFNGAKKYGHGEFDHTLELAGGDNNAYTSNDVTVYTDFFPSTALQAVFDLEADRIQNLQFDPAVIKSEREVVYSERRLRTDNSNPGLLNEQLYASAYTAAPYHWPVVGWPSDIESWTMDDLKSYFSMGYSPNNATMVVVGNVKAAEVFRLADQYIGPIPTHPTPPPVRTREPAQQGERRVSVTKFAQAPLIDIAYHAVAAKDKDYYPLAIVDNLLTTGQSSRLYRALVDGQQLATRVDSGIDQRIDPSLFELSAQPRKGIAADRLEAAIYTEIQRLTTDGPAPEELQKAKNQAIAAHYRSLRSISGRAQQIGQQEVIFGDYHKLATVEQSIDAVTAADVQRVLKQYFQPTNRTVATLIPTAGGAQ